LRQAYDYWQDQPGNYRLKKAFSKKKKSSPFNITIYTLENERRVTTGCFFFLVSAGSTELVYHGCGTQKRKKNTKCVF